MDKKKKIIVPTDEIEVPTKCGKKTINRLLPAWKKYYANIVIKELKKTKQRKKIDPIQAGERRSPYKMKSTRYKNRVCLSCGNTFKSYGPQNRICDTCHRNKDFYDL